MGFLGLPVQSADQAFVVQRPPHGFPEAPSEVL
jgi:hypothetical protein